MNSESIYLGVLEVGLSLIAVNLPSLWSLFSTITPERILHSVRSMISLRSVPSAGSMGGDGSRRSNRRPSHFDERSHSSSSRSHVIKSDGHYFETYAMHDQDGREHGSELPLGKIQVTESMSQSATHV